MRVYRSVLDVLGNLGVAAAQHVSLIRARLEASTAVLKTAVLNAASS